MNKDSRQALSLTVKIESAGYEGKVALKDVDLKLNPGDRLAVIGPNGSGKSTFLKTLAGFIDFAGQIELAGQNLTQKLKNARFPAVVLGYMPQSEDIELDFPITVQKLLDMATWVLPAQKQGSAQALIKKFIERLGLNGYLDHSLNMLSGGQLQRALLARTLALDSQIFLLDEPDNALDVNARRAIGEIFAQQASLKKIIIFSTHDLNFAQEHSDYILFVNHKQIAFGKSSEVCNVENLLQTFGARAIHTHDNTLIDTEAEHGHH